jgi:ATP-dependent Clp protease ATP-binding subunit ClpB
MAIRWEKLTVKSQQAMEQAQARATELGNPEVQPVHLLLALIEDREGVIPSVLEKIGVPTQQLEHELHQIEEKLPRVAGAALIRFSTRPSVRRPTSRTSTFPLSIYCWA